MSNSGSLIHLAKIDKLILLKELFGEVIIPLQVKIEVVDDLAARRFAIGLGLEVTGSIGVLFKYTKLKMIS